MSADNVKIYMQKEDLINLMNGCQLGFHQFEMEFFKDHFDYHDQYGRFKWHQSWLAGKSCKELLQLYMYYKATK